MKQILLPALLLILSFALRAQISFKVIPDQLVFALEADMEDEFSYGVAYAWVINTSNQTVNLRWERVMTGSDCPSEWKYQICDNNQCYPTFVTSNVVVGGQPNVPVLLAPGDTTVLQIHVLPNKTPDCCSFDINLSEAGDPNNVIETASFSVCVSDLTSSASELSKANLRVFPNPTAEYFSVTKNPYVKQLWVSNILGKRVRSFSAQFNNGKYDISDLPDGIYLVSMVDRKGKVMKTVRVSKRNPRP